MRRVYISSKLSRIVVHATTHCAHLVLQGPVPPPFWINHIGSGILNFVTLTWELWLSTPKTLEYQISSQSNNCLPFCIARAYTAVILDQPSWILQFLHQNCNCRTQKSRSIKFRASRTTISHFALQGPVRPPYWIRHFEFYNFDIRLSTSKTREC